MGKRKHSKEDSYETIARKLKKLERKLKYSKRKRRDLTPSTVSSECDEMLSDYPKMLSDNEDGTGYESNPVSLNEVEETEQVIPHKISSVVVANTGCNVEPVPSTSAVEPVPSTSAVEPVPSTSSCELPAAQDYGQNPDMDVVPEVDTAILELLGDDPSVTKLYGKDINADLAVRLQHTVTVGLSKDLRKDLQGKYLPPKNCTQIDAPQLNPEIKAAVSDIVMKRDKGIESKQKVLGSAISCLGDAITILLDEQNKNTTVIKLLMDASRLICDCQNTDSNTRRNFILYNLKKDMKDQLLKTKIDNFLFGSDLAETLKTAKSITKSSADLKINPNFKTPTSKKLQVPSTTQRNNLNWKAPPPVRRPKMGNQRREPAPKNQQPSSSRISYRQPPHGNPARNRQRQ